jgi:lysophospholipase L1-like esterase
MGMTGSLWKKFLSYALLATAPSLLLFGLAEGAARLYRGDLKIRRVFVPVGHEEYFGTRKVVVPYRTFPPQYYWLPEANTPLTNSRGFRGREFSDRKEPGTLRIVCLGCSCTLGGQAPYPARLERLLAEALGRPKYEVINAAVGSSSTYQGLKILQNHVLALEPDIVTVFFGWNDRWIQDGLRDSRHRLPTRTETEFVETLSKSRFIRLMMYLADRWRGRRIEQRVPPEEYEANLREIVRLCRQRGIRVLLCTAPDGMPARRIESLFLKSRNEFSNFQALYAMFREPGQTPVDVWHSIHRLYNDKVIRVAGDTGADLVDLQTEVNERQSQYTDPAAGFYQDGIHFTELGLQEVGRILATHLLRDDERLALTRYLESPLYYRRNMERFVEESEFAAADAMLDRGETLSRGSFPNSETLRKRFAKERSFYDPYYAARRDFYGGENRVEAFWRMYDCLQRRPDNADLRLDLARIALATQSPQVTLDLVRAPEATYTNSAARYDGLWLGVEAADALGRREIVQEQLREILKWFPDDSRAHQMLADRK